MGASRAGVRICSEETGSQSKANCWGASLWRTAPCCASLAVAHPAVLLCGSALRRVVPPRLCCLAVVHCAVLCLLGCTVGHRAVLQLPSCSALSRACSSLVLAHVVSSLRLILPLEGSPLCLIPVGLLSIIPELSNWC